MLADTYKVLGLLNSRMAKQTSKQANKQKPFVRGWRGGWGLRACIAFPEDLSVFLIFILDGLQPPVALPSVDLMPSSDFQRQLHSRVYTCMHTHTHTGTH